MKVYGTLRYYKIANYWKLSIYSLFTFIYLLK